MPHRYETLLTPFVLGNGVVLKNRLVQPKCAPDQNQGPEEWPTEQFIHFHREMARRGSSLVVLCDADRPEVRKMPAWHDFSHSYHFDTSNPAVHNYLCQLADDVHFYGSRIVVQMAPRLPAGVSIGGGNPPRMQSAEGFMDMPPGVMATKEQIRESIEGFAERCRMYQQWGYDGVSIGVTGLERETDLRTDEYGGSTENRCRYTLELCRAVKKACGDRFIIEVMHLYECLKGGMGGLRDGYTLEDTITFCMLAEGLVDLMQVREKDMTASHPTGFTFQKGEHHCIEAIRRMKAAGVKIPLAAAGGFQDPEEMERLLKSGACELISVGRGQFTDPDYYEKIIGGHGEDIRPCVRCNRCHGRRRAPWTSVCTVNPEFGMELKTRHMVQPVKRIKRVAVIGGGSAGMEAAYTAAKRGHKVTLYEKSGCLGGQLIYGDHFAFKWPFREFRLWQIRELEKAGVEVRLGIDPEPKQLAADGYDAIIAAVGSRAKLPPIDGMRAPDGSPAVRTCREIIGREGELGKSVIIVGCSETGIETACYLAQNGHDVTCLTRQDRLAKDASPLHSITIAWVKTDPETGYGYMAPYWERFENIKGITSVSTVRVTPNSVTYIDAGGEANTLHADDVLACGGVEADTAAALKYATFAPEFYVVGDAADMPDLQTGIRSAFAAASQI